MISTRHMRGATSSKGLDRGIGTMMAVSKIFLCYLSEQVEQGEVIVVGSSPFTVVGIGTAEESSASKPSLKLKNHLADQGKLQTKEKVHLLQVAARLSNIDMTRELLGRGGTIADICNIQVSTQEEDKIVEHVLQQIDHVVEHGTDQPTLSDDLGRSAFANGLAALFLNTFFKSPITVGISGE